MKHKTRDRFFAAPTAIVCGIATVPLAVTSAAFGTATLALAATGIGIPFAIPFAAGTVATAAAATYTGSKTIHSTSRLFGSEKKCHSLSHAKEVLTLGSSF